MKKSEIKITTTMGEIAEKGYWLEYCEKYGVNEWCRAEGLAENETEVQIYLDDAEKWNIIEN